MCPYQNSYNI